MAHKGYVLYECLERNQKKTGDSKYKHLKLPSAKSPKTKVTEHDVICLVYIVGQNILE